MPSPLIPLPSYLRVTSSKMFSIRLSGWLKRLQIFQLAYSLSLPFSLFCTLKPYQRINQVSRYLTKSLTLTRHMVEESQI